MRAKVQTTNVSYMTVDEATDDTRKVRENFGTGTC